MAFSSFHEGESTFSNQDIMSICSIMSDLQEMLDTKEVQGKLNLIKSFLWKKSIIKREGFTYWFENVNPESRFCSNCGLLREGEYKECECTEGE